MLAIQPVSASNYNRSSKVQFKGWEDEIAQGRQTIEDGQRAIDKILSDEQIPGKLKKPLNFFKVLTNAALEGLAVFGSVMILGDFLKKGKGNKVVLKATEKAKPIAKKAAEYAKDLGKLLQKGTERVKNTSWGQKVVSKIGKMLGTMKAKRMLVRVRQFSRAVLKPFNKILNKVLKPFNKNIDADKTIKGVATALGFGSGVTGAYEATMTPEERNNLPEEDWSREE